MLRSRFPRKRQKSFKTAAVFAVALVAIFMMAVGFQRSGLPSTLSTLLNADFENFRNLQQFDSTVAKEVRRSLAGFWTYAEGDPETSPVAKREYMELIDNGIMWKVNVWDINTPTGYRETLTQVQFGYFNPYSRSPDGSVYYCETRVIRQAFIADGDTCYGASQADEIWQFGRSEGGDALTVDQREYRQFTGDIKEFFPDGDLLDVPDKISLSRCPAAMSLPWMSKKLLARSLAIIPFFTRAQATDELIRLYYKPIVFDELARMYDPRAVPDVMPVKLTITPDGEVTDLRYRRANIATKRFDDLATLDIKSWLFNPAGDASEPQRLDLTIRVK